MPRRPHLGAARLVALLAAGHLSMVGARLAEQRREGEPPMSTSTHAAPSIPGDTLGTPTVPCSPLSMEELALLQKTVLFTDEDVKYLRLSGEVLAGQEEAMLDVWYGFVGSHPHLVYYFGRKVDGQSDGDYLAAVRKRFARWIQDTAAASYDQAWLKSVILPVTLGSQPYILDGDF